MIPALFFNLRKGLVPLMHQDSYDAMSRVVDSITAAGAERGYGSTKNGASGGGGGMGGMGSRGNVDDLPVKKQRIGSPDGVSTSIATSTSLSIPHTGIPHTGIQPTCTLEGGCPPCYDEMFM